MATKVKKYSTPEDAYANMTKAMRHTLAMIAKYPQFYEDVPPIIARRLHDLEFIDLKEDCYREGSETPFCVDVWYISCNQMAHNTAKLVLKKLHSYSIDDFYPDYQREIDRIEMLTPTD